MYGLNQAILGRLIEVMTGLLEDYLSQNPFGPLNMVDTSCDGRTKEPRFQPLWINLKFEGLHVPSQ